MRPEMRVIDRGNAVIVELSGELGLSEAAECRRVVWEGLNANAGLDVDMSGVKSMDISILQLMHALRCEGKRVGKKVKRCSALPEGVAQTAADAGFGWPHCGCVCGEARCVFQQE